MNWSGFRRKLCFGKTFALFLNFFHKTVETKRRSSLFLGGQILNSDFPMRKKNFISQSAPIFGVMGLCKVNMMIILVGKHQRGYRVLRFSCLHRRIQRATQASATVTLINYSS